MSYYLETKEKQQKVTRIVVIVLSILIFSFIIFKINNFNEKNYNDTEAIVTDSVVSSIGETTAYVVSYKYIVNGEEYTGKYWEKIRLLVPKEGKTIKIKYSKDNVEISKINQFSRIYKHLFIILISIIIVFIFFKIKYKKV